MSKLTVAGIGPGEADYILPAVIEKMKKAHTVIAAKRVLPILEELCQDVSDSASVLQHDSMSFFAMGKIKDTLEQIGKILSEGHDVVMAVSGDPLMYSLYRTIWRGDGFLIIATQREGNSFFTISAGVPDARISSS